MFTSLWIVLAVFALYELLVASVYIHPRPIGFNANLSMGLGNTQCHIIYITFQDRYLKTVEDKKYYLSESINVG